MTMGYQLMEHFSCWFIATSYPDSLVPTTVHTLEKSIT